MPNDDDDEVYEYMLYNARIHVPICICYIMSVTACYSERWKWHPSNIRNAWFRRAEIPGELILNFLRQFSHDFLLL